jgi:hypothetical protein
MFGRSMVAEGIMEKEEGLEAEQDLPDNLSLLFLTSSLSFGGNALILSSSSFSLFCFNSLVNRIRHSWNAWGVRGVPRVRAASAWFISSSPSFSLSSRSLLISSIDRLCAPSSRLIHDYPSPTMTPCVTLLHPSTQRYTTPLCFPSSAAPLSFLE